MLVGRFSGERRFVAPHAAHALIAKGDARPVEEVKEETMKILMKETVVAPGGKLHAGTVYEVPDAEAQGHISSGLAEPAPTAKAQEVPKFKKPEKKTKAQLKAEAKAKKKPKK